MAGRGVLVASAVAAFVVTAGIVVAVTHSEPVEAVGAHGCAADVEGATLRPTVEDSGTQREEGGYIRVVSYSLDAAGLGAGALSACTLVGGIDVGVADGDVVSVEFVIEGDVEEAVSATRVDAIFADAGDRLNVGAAPVEVGVRKGLFDREGAAVSVTILLPASGAWALDVATDVGDVHVGPLLLASADVRTDVGDVDLAGADLAGDLTAATDVGDLDVHLASVAEGALRLASEVGSIDLALPDRPDVGYAVVASSDVGSVDVDLGPGTEKTATEDEGPGDRVEARSAGYDARPTQVTVQATSDVGDIDVAAAP